MGPDEKLELTMKEMQRIEILRRVDARRLDVDSGATALGRSVRTVFRMLATLRSKGIKGLRHGNKGRPSPRRLSQAVLDQVLELARGEFTDVNDTHLRELLFRRKKLRLGRETLRSLLRAEVSTCNATVGAPHGFDAILTRCCSGGAVRWHACSSSLQSWLRS
jgi:transposase